MQPRQNICWLRRSPLEIALILTLIIAIPYLILIVAVYVLAILQKLPGYSQLCSKYCSEAQSSTTFSVNPGVFEDNDKYQPCPQHVIDKMKHGENFRHIASVLEDVYQDDFVRQKFLCPAAIVSLKWVIVSTKYVEYHNSLNVLYVRAGSQTWSSEGVVRKVKNVATYKSVATAIELISPFPLSPNIETVSISKTSLFKRYVIAEMYFWPTNDSAPVYKRQKYSSLQSHAAIVVPKGRCSISTQNAFSSFCITSIVFKLPCDYITGFILLQNSKLMGFDIDSVCDENLKTTLYHVFDVSDVIDWLQQISDVDSIVS